MRSSLVALLVVAGLLGSMVAPSRAQSPSGLPVSWLASPRSTPQLPPGPFGYKTQAIDTTLFYYDNTFASGTIIDVPLEDDDTGVDIEAAGIFFEAPFDGSVERIDFELSAFDPAVSGTGTLRIKLMPASSLVPNNPFVPGLDSIDVELATLETSFGPAPGNLPNQIDVSAQDFPIEKGREYFLLFTLVDASDDAAVTFVFDGGSEDEDDPRYFPPRSWVYYNDGNNVGFIPVDDSNSDRINANLIVEIALSEAPPPPPDPTALMQIVHNAPSLATVDVYVGGERVADDLAYQEATAFVEVLAGDGQTLEVVAGDAEDASAPLSSTTADLAEDLSYVAMTYGLPDDGVAVSVADLSTETPTTAVFAHGGVGAGPVDLRILDDTPDHEPLSTLVDDLALGAIRGPLSVETGTFNVELTAADNTTSYDVFRVELGTGNGSSTPSVFLISGTVDTGLMVLHVAADGTVTMPDVNTAAEDPDDVPGTFALHANYPNPFNPTTTIPFDLGTPAYTTLTVFDLTGRAVATLVATPLPAGRHQVVFDARSLPSGAYIYRLASGAFRQHRLLMLVK